MFVEDKKVGEAKTQDPASEWFVRAADYIELHGWCQGKSRDEQERVCITGALNRTMPASASHPVVISYAHEMDRLVGAIGCIATWNDAPGRTKQEVVDLLLKLYHASVVGAPQH